MRPFLYTIQQTLLHSENCNIERAANPVITASEDRYVNLTSNKHVNITHHVHKTSNYITRW